MTDTPRHSVSVAAVVVRDDGHVLAVRRADNGTWEPPGGVLELGETVEDGLMREVLEETGLEVEVNQLTGVYKNMARGVVALVFRCRPVGGTPTPSDETTAVTWLTPEEAETAMRSVYAIRVHDGLHPGDTVPVRHHDGDTLSGS